MRSVDILGMRVHDVTYPEALDVIERFIEEGRPRLVTTPNTEFAMRQHRDRTFQAVLSGADLAIPDGIGLVLASKLLGNPLREHVRGSDLVEALAERAARKGYRFFLLGAAEGIAAEAGKRLAERFPGLQIAGTHSGSPRADDDETTFKVIRASGRVDILLVAYGAPGQEEWIARNREALGIPVAIGVGGVLDFFSGRAKRAPRWVQRIELEWLYRLLKQPSRWRRQLALPRFALWVLGLWVRKGLRRSV